MRKFAVEIYELYVRKFEVEADNAAEAVAGVIDETLEMTDLGNRFLEHATEYGMPRNDNEDIATVLADRELIRGSDDILPSIHSVTELES